MTHRLLAVILSLAFIFSNVGLAEAYDWKWKNIDFELKGQMLYTARVRTEHPHWRLLKIYMGDPNASILANLMALDVTGNQNFDKGDLVNNKVAEIWELEIKSEYVNFFFRDEVFVDFVYFDGHRFDDETKEHAATNMTDLLEFYLEGVYDRFTCRIGRQIIQWGESIAPIFAPTVNVPNQMSADKASSAGYTTRDYYVPGYMLWMNYELENVSFEAIYAPHFDPRPGYPPVGTFMSPVDLIGYNALDVALGIMDVIDLRPRDFEDMQQYGGAIRMVLPALNYLELGFYYFHYMNRMPVQELKDFELAMTGGRARVEISYPEVDMFGMSASHTIQAFDLGLQLGGDIAYRPNAANPTHFWLKYMPALQYVIGADSLGPMGPYDEGQSLNWSVTGMKMWFDVMPFTPWTVGLTGLFEIYGGWNMDYDGEKTHAYPEVIYYYTVSPELTTSDMIDNTKVTLGISAMGNLHQEQHNLHHLIFNLKAKYGDSWEVTLGYDWIFGDEIEETRQYLPGVMIDRDAFTFKFVYFLI